MSSVSRHRTIWNRWLNDPLLHFLLIGALMFAVYSYLHRNQSPQLDKQQIVFTEDDLLQLVVSMRAQGFSEPGPGPMRSLLEARIREEVLYREALAMGLDRDDTIVRRRMAQKMDFLAEDLSSLREPTGAELRDWLASHPQDFAYPPRITFRHLYFSFDDRGEQAHGDAIAALETAVGKKMDAPDVAELGDPFMFQETYADRTADQLVRVFGGTFADGLFKLEPGAWAGPVESGFGWHLVFIESLTPGRVPEFEEVEDEVRTEWMANQRAEFKREAYEVLRAKYEVILPEGFDTELARTKIVGGSENEK